MSVTSAWSPRGSPIRVGLVGLGNVGLGHHLPAFEGMPELARVVAVADPVGDRRALAAERLGLGPEAAFATPEELIDEADVDVVDLATPPASRVELALRAVAAGRAVVCEKPLALAPADGERLVSAASAAGIPVGIVHNWLLLPEVLAARAAIAAGAIGRSEIAIVNALGVEDRPGSVAWRPGWRHDPAMAGGGVLMDMLHLVYLAEAFLGSPFRRVSAEILVREDGAAVEEVAVCRFDTDNAIGLVNVGWGSGPGGMTISGPDGRIEIAYASGGTGPFVPLAAVRVVGRDGAIADRTPRDLPAPGVIDVRVADDIAVPLHGPPRRRHPAQPRDRRPPGARCHPRRLCLGGHRTDRRATASRPSPGPSTRDRGPRRPHARSRFGDRPTRRLRRRWRDAIGKSALIVDSTRRFRMELGLYTDSLAHMELDAVLDVAARIGATGIEIATGGQSSAPHLDLGQLLASADTRARLLDAVGDRGLHLAALNCSAWLLHPQNADAQRTIVEDTFRLAEPARRRPGRHDVRLPRRRAGRDDRELGQLSVAR